MKGAKLYAMFIIVFAFLLGWTSANLFTVNALESPNPVNTILSTQKNEVSAPSDIIPESNIQLFSDKVVIYVDNPQWARFADTKSMVPVFDKGANAIQIKPTSENQIHVGDIISFITEYDSGVIIHRVIEIGSDEDGWYAITKGDNNKSKDPGKVRFDQIRKLLIGIIY